MAQAAAAVVVQGARHGIEDRDTGQYRAGRQIEQVPEAFGGRLRGCPDDDVADSGHSQPHGDFQRAVEVPAQVRTPEKARPLGDGGSQREVESGKTGGPHGRENGDVQGGGHQPVHSPQLNRAWREALLQPGQQFQEPSAVQGQVFILEIDKPQTAGGPSRFDFTQYGGHRAAPVGRRCGRPKGAVTAAEGAASAGGDLDGVTSGAPVGVARD